MLQKDYTQAKKSLEKAKELVENHPQTNQLTLIEINTNLAIVCAHLGESSHAK